MRFLWVLLGLLLLFWALSRLRLGVYAVFGDVLKLDVTAGPVHINVLPAGEKKQKKKPKTASEPAKKKTEGKAQGSKKPKITLADIRSAADALLPPLKRALARTRRSIRVKPLELSVSVGGAEDPAAAAEMYGYIHMGVWTGMPALEQLLVIPDPHIHVGIDFDAPQTVFKGEAGVTLRLGTLVAVAFGVGIPAVRWFLQLRKKQRSATADEAQAKTPAA